MAGQTGNLDPSQRTWQKWFNIAAFALPPNGRFGNSPRTDAIRLPGMENIDFSVTKSVRFRESRTFEFRAEFFNLLNHFNPDPQTWIATFVRVLLGLSAEVFRGSLPE